jgi:hypothetical protein
MYLTEKEKLLIDSIIRTNLEHLKIDDVVGDYLNNLIVGNDWDDEKYQLYVTYRFKLWLIERLGKDVMKYEEVKNKIDKGRNPIGFKY